MLKMFLLSGGKRNWGIGEWGVITQWLNKWMNDEERKRPRKAVCYELRYMFQYSVTEIQNIAFDILCFYKESLLMSFKISSLCVYFNLGLVWQKAFKRQKNWDKIWKPLPVKKQLIVNFNSFEIIINKNTLPLAKYLFK